MCVVVGLCYLFVLVFIILSVDYDIMDCYCFGVSVYLIKLVGVYGGVLGGSGKKKGRVLKRKRINRNLMALM